ncbi:uncharacterized protein LOC133297877 [Gastrolobium bilobum]|uniref:uncharacterized protein LOC133297877 n=1 Tax=Gastrolobium bilobum TaxID=150636 RepID=UPI002AB1D6DE|nr:uncharacterized protein LOC133297877 [Gastrolobium bilobum]
MDLAFRSPLYLPSPSTTTTTTTRRPNYLVRPLRSTTWKLSMSMTIPSAQVAYDSVLENKKHQLLNSLQDTQRGLLTTPDQRSSIEEALVNVEGCNMGEPINLAMLDGTWCLQYTCAPDVLILLQAAATLPFFQLLTFLHSVGQIFQKFECRDQSNGGVIRNIVWWSIPNLLEQQEGATLLVSAKFSVVSVRNIYLKFEEITVQDINISEELQALIAPAILPRTFISLQIKTLLGDYDAIHVRRGDKIKTRKDRFGVVRSLHPHLDRDTRPEFMICRIAKWVPPGRTLFIASNERIPGFFSSLSVRYRLAYSSNYSHILDPLIENNYQLFMIERFLMMGAKTFIRTFKEGETDLSLTDDPKKNTKVWQIPVYNGDETC